MPQWFQNTTQYNVYYDVFASQRDIHTVKYYTGSLQSRAEYTHICQYI